MVLLYAFPGQFRIVFMLEWALMVTVFARRRTFFPQINSSSSDMQDAFTFFGWFVLAVLGAGAGAMLLLGSGNQTGVPIFRPDLRNA